MKIARINIEKGTIYAEYRDGKYYPIAGDIFNKYRVLEKSVTPLKLLAPVLPTKIIALGANYKKHAEELHLNVNSVPTIFMKPTTSVLEPNGNIIYPNRATQVDYEAELAIVIKKQCRYVQKQDASSVILGYTCANDVSERVFQKMDGQWTRAKGYDTFCPLGSYIETEVDPACLELKAIVNGEIRQKGNTKDLIHNIPSIISFVSEIMTLNAGDVILTGTPEGVGRINIGDTVEINIEKIGSIVNKVVAE